MPFAFTGLAGCPIHRGFIAMGGMSCRCSVSAKGASHTSLGRSPRVPAHPIPRGLKARPIACSSLTAHSRNKKIAAAHPQKPQQFRVSSPSTPKNPPNSHPINHFPHKNSWHSSYAPLDTLNIWIKSIEGQLRPRGNRPPPPACTVLSQLNKPHRINIMPATPMQ
jgi:hypothetical protein